MDRETDAIPTTRVIRRGDIFWVAPDESRGSIPGVPHPHVVVQDDVFNHSRISTVIVCALSSNLHRSSEPGVVLLELGEGNLLKQSVVISSQVSSLYKSRLGDYIGTPHRVDKIVAALKFLQTSFLR